MQSVRGVYRRQDTLDVLERSAAVLIVLKFDRPRSIAAALCASDGADPAMHPASPPTGSRGSGASGRNHRKRLPPG